MAAAPAHAPACVSQSVGTPIALREPPSGLRWRELGPLLATAAAAASPAPSSAATHFAGSLGSADLHPNSSTSSGGSDGGATASTPRRQHTACLEHLLRTPVAPVLRPQASLQSERDAASGTPRPGCYRLGTPLSSPAALSLRYVHGTPEGTPRWWVGVRSTHGLIASRLPAAPPAQGCARQLVRLPLDCLLRPPLPPPHPLTRTQRAARLPPLRQLHSVAGCQCLTYQPHGTAARPRSHPPGVLSPWPAATLALSPRPMHTMQPCSVRLTGSGKKARRWLLLLLPLAAAAAAAAAAARPLGHNQHLWWLCPACRMPCLAAFFSVPP